ncbi:MAG: right-handed parallel beta-helix repeat-containing protein [Candidatus Bathyarchaeota archaeon]|jgi:parallel beta-helix repeat protein
MCNLTKSFALGLVVAFFMSSLIVPSILAETESGTLVVPDDYQTIQEAIGKATEGDTIYIKKGTYVENPVVNKSVSLVGEDMESTVIDVTAGLKVQSDNVNITGLTLFDGWQGITVSADYCNISGNKVTDSEYGIVLLSAANNIVTKNVIHSIGPSAAIQLSYSNANLIEKNYIDSCTEGIQVKSGSCNNLVTENLVTHCSSVAMRLLGTYSPPSYYEPNDNTITNNVLSNSGVGATIYRANNNTLYNNNFINNTYQISTNEWYAQQWGYGFSNNTIDQNYWSNYNGTDNNSDDIGDTPYIIDEHNQDNQPLMNPAETDTIPEFPSWTILPLLVTATLAALTYRKRMHNTRQSGRSY